MAARQRIIPIRRQYNRWVADETLEDYALRFTAKSARRWSQERVAQTAIGAISFLALEAIGGAITLSYGTVNAVAAIVAASLAMLAVGWPIARTAARHGVDIDLLTRGAGFGYIGSTVTSLIYASFTFILFAIEASIMSTALEMALGLPLWAGYVVSTLLVIPLVTHGIAWISRFQILTQPIWIVLNILPFVFIAFSDGASFSDWAAFAGRDGGSGGGFHLVAFGSASAVILALTAQIGEQVDFLRFLPARLPGSGRRRLAVFLAGAGWVVLGVPKMIAGSFLAVLVLSSGVPIEHAAEPARMYAVAFGYVLPEGTWLYLLTAAFVVVSQLKINVMNAYAGSLAWSNFFSRLTHSHPGRVVWLVFNVSIALLLMEIGIYEALEQTLAVFAIVAVAWLSTISADLLINKPLGISPPGIEFKRAHLWDVNPVGVGAMAVATVAGLLAHVGIAGSVAEAFAPFVALVAAFATAPLIAWLTDGRFYLARKPRRSYSLAPTLTCSVCQHDFEAEDMSYCPAYQAPICSLCCSLDARCHDRCKPKARLGAQARTIFERLLPPSLVAAANTRLGRYLIELSLWVALSGLIMWFVYRQAAVDHPGEAVLIGRVLAVVFFVFSVVIGVVVWFFVLARDSRGVAEEESARQTQALFQEIAAHKRTDAELQKAKEKAEAASDAKSRYVVGLSHELRTPLNAVLGYAQILERDPAIADGRRNAVGVIRRSAEHLSGLIDGLLDISRIEAGRFRIRLTDVRIHDLLDQIEGMFALQAEAKGLAFHASRAADLPAVVRTDEKRLRQVLVNLLSNAIKFTEKGTVTLGVDYRNQVARFTVADTGLGIPEDDQGRVFEPFERGRHAASTTIPGLGLGLTITRLLVETMGGDIAMTSAPGAGTTFRVRLMLGAVVGAAAIDGDRPVTGYVGSRRTILVVDDNAEHRDMMVEMLAPLGFTVLTADGGEVCLALMETARPDILFVDIRMPGMTGWQLVSRLRTKGVRTPIVMLSANIGDGAMPASDLGHDDLLAKPFSLADLLDRLGHHLGISFLETGSGEPAISTSAGSPAVFSAADLAELKSLAAIGYVRGLEGKLAALAETDADPAAIATLSSHLAAFDLARFTATLEDMTSS
ncbi:hybrid sensor histidine kinase/response regulator [Pleomorphomonas diazotrophica]|uniref:histidine kinase n=1 Tax=Pleomorphomonas diazotrophica TaxID=1166257 RepID=A0A1I4WQI5_9HYPH|nr:ATP-binding protein [Pleomorphomonas diazotrophica]PKR87288.1 hybrid sensor histidine kinase/response regulator [Pleomorphomonas diazotrophica]SFN15815.1 Signal transduction histidine kinase [Pleomorphomonas diazotrophica]